jgi:hypothetical protein
MIKTVIKCFYYVLESIAFICDVFAKVNNFISGYNEATKIERRHYNWLGKLR